MLRDGKIRYWGVSNFRAWRINEMNHLARQLGMPSPVVCQPYYNLLNRMPEVEILPACAHHGIGVVPYSPVARGVLTGKYAPGQPAPASTRAGRGDKRIGETEFREESLQIAQTLKAHAEARGVTLAQFATAWVLAHQAVSSVIAGPRTLAQWQDYRPALDYRFTAEDEALVDTLVRPGHPVHAGLHRPGLPAGRAGAQLNHGHNRHEEPIRHRRSGLFDRIRAHVPRLPPAAGAVCLQARPTAPRR
jgi:aryl-alcohol dehydrogenase-like predicted oxidoreductase